MARTPKKCQTRLVAAKVSGLWVHACERRSLVRLKSSRKAVVASDIAAPTPERMAQGGIRRVTERLPGIETRRGFRATPPIDAYAKRGWVTDRQADAGRRFASIA